MHSINYSYIAYEYFHMIVICEIIKLIESL